MEILERIQAMPTDAPKAFAPMQQQILDEPVPILRVYRAKPAA
jgi:hypothetical protein